MDDNQIKIYIKGFEHGYWLKRGDSPELDDLINRQKHETYKSGLKAGKKEAKREKVRERLQNNDPHNKHDRGIDFEQ